MFPSLGPHQSCLIPHQECLLVITSTPWVYYSSISSQSGVPEGEGSKSSQKTREEGAEAGLELVQSKEPGKRLEQQHGDDLQGGLEKRTGMKAKLELMAALTQREEWVLNWHLAVAQRAFKQPGSWPCLTMDSPWWPWLQSHCHQLMRELVKLFLQFNHPEETAQVNSRFYISSAGLR